MSEIHVHIVPFYQPISVVTRSLCPYIYVYIINIYTLVYIYTHINTHTEPTEQTARMDNTYICSRVMVLAASHPYFGMRGYLGKVMISALLLIS